jgi:hypothetical protein
MSAVMPTSLDAQPLEPDAAAAARDIQRANDKDASPSERAVSAVERLAASRERLRAAMLPAPRSAESAWAGSIGATVSRLTDRVRAMPGAAVLIDAVEAWWAQHPLRTVSRVAAEGARRFAAPIAERRPMTLVFGAVLVGALLALLKPWRWALRPALLAGLLPAVLARAMRELPLDTLFRSASTFGKTAASSAWSTATSAEEAAAVDAARAMHATPDIASPPRSAPATAPLAAAAMQP